MGHLQRMSDGCRMDVQGQWVYLKYCAILIRLCMRWDVLLVITYRLGVSITTTTQPATPPLGLTYTYLVISFGYRRSIVLFFKKEKKRTSVWGPSFVPVKWMRVAISTAAMLYYIHYTLCKARLGDCCTGWWEQLTRNKEHQFVIIYSRQCCWIAQFWELVDGWVEELR